MAILYVMVGIPGSGKSTYAKELAEKENAVILSSDAIRKRLFKDEGCQDKPWLVFKILNESTVKNLSKEINVIYDSTNVDTKSRKNVLKLVKDIDCKKVAVFINTDIETAKKRNAGRERIVPDDVIERMVKNLKEPILEEGFDEILVINSNT